MVWGVCTWSDVGPLIRLDTSLTDDRYLSILSDYLRPFIVYSDKFGEFQQDNATPHTSRIATKWLQELSSEFRHFKRSPKSQDMNIIEYIWDALQHAVQMRSPPPLIFTDLWTVLQDSWCQLPTTLIQTLIETMPRRIADFCVLVGALHDIMQM
ncbi:transposable element Tcb2 transposase [Trichonephila clavipes]|nr:transposable element Tcb2 transposase [Trichonephila clavipes]